MKKLLIPVVLLLASASALMSCSKDKSPKNTHERFVGTWKIYQDGEDDNGNGIWDANEKKDYIDFGAGFTTFTFNEDGSGTVLGEGGNKIITDSLTWNLQNANRDIRIITTFVGYSDSTVQNIVSITDNILVLKDNTQSPMVFKSFNKQ